MDEGLSLGLTQLRPAGPHESEITLKERLGLIEEFAHYMPADQRQKFLAHVAEAMNEVGMVDVDPLTGLFKREYIMKYLVRVLARTRVPGIGVLFTDIDNFKQFNTNHGHAGGDKALAATGAVLRRMARESDRMGRLSDRADEFIAVLVSSGSYENFSIAANRIFKAINDPEKQREEGYDLPTPLHISVGCAWIDWFPTVDRRLHAEAMAKKMLEGADELMYQSKSTGRLPVRHFKLFKGQVIQHVECTLG